MVNKKSLKNKRMKSIKEKAKDYLFNPIAQRTPNILFEAGANYVLDEIEKFQKLFSTCMNAHANGYLTSVIEQLKN